MIDATEITPDKIKQVKQKVRGELVRILFKQIKHMVWAEAFAATMMLYILWWHSDTAKIVLLSWYSYMVVVSSIPRYYLGILYKRAKPLDEHSGCWEKSIMFLLLLSALGWSLCGTLLLPKSGFYQAFVLFLLVGVAATANPFYSPIKKVYATFLVPTLLFVACYMLWQNSIWQVFTGLALLSFGILMMTTAIVSSQLISTALMLRYDNLQLTDNLLKANKTLADLATHDPLTGLPNRQLFNETLSRTIQQAAEYNRSFILLFLDIDKFKSVNDTLGHDVGDQLLIEVADRLHEHVETKGMVSRLGGDEFIVLVDNIYTKESAAQIAAELCQVLAQSVRLKQHTIHVSTSIGISVYPQDGATEEALLQYADLAMYVTKKRGGNSYTFYDKNTVSQTVPKQ